jgi:hypothetical protein
VTHDSAVARRAQRTGVLRRGKISFGKGRKETRRSEETRDEETW